MSRRRRSGLRPEPPGGWPLDELLVGVATLRTTRELLRQENERWSRPRAWDLALWSGVSPQGSANSLERLDRLGLVRALSPARPAHASTFRVRWRHPLVPPLADLFDAERAMVHRRSCIGSAPTRGLAPGHDHGSLKTPEARARGR